MSRFPKKGSYQASSSSDEKRGSKSDSKGSSGEVVTKLKARQKFQRFKAKPSEKEDEAKWEIDEKDPSEVAKSVESVIEKLGKSGALKMIKDEFMRSRNYFPEGSKKAFANNEKHNRYRDILLLDRTRVVLKNTGHDYIHASKVIVMLCRFIEGGQEKCCEYIPKSRGRLVFGSFKIECTAREILPNTDGATCGQIEVTFIGRTYKLEHIWYENWADHAAPENLAATMELLRVCRKKRQNAPVLIHCSAGVGRSGCFVAIELAAHHAATRPVFSMEAVLKDLRDQRMHCIQNDMQYLYVYRGFVEMLIDRGIVKRNDVLKFITDYEHLLKRKRSKPTPDSAEKNQESKEKESKEKESKEKDEFIPSVYFNDPYRYY
ncbi:hypothetical protein Q1695_005489 [Nippostrongylus brasiliensis]|nr:hypothetical protein Q1695_005489 [Nippostrongylus brasiliensis]